MKKNKTIALFAASLASVLTLASCEDVEARPDKSFEDQPILNIDDIYNNTMGEIYDAIVTPSNTNSERVLSNVLYLYSQTIYGSFFDTTLADGTSVKGLKSTVESYLANTANNMEIQAFADAFTAYGGQIDKVVNFYKEVLYRVRAVFFGYVKDATYQVRSQFSERLFYNAQTKSYYDLAQKDGDAYPYNEDYKQVQGSFRLTEEIVETGSMVLDGQDVKKVGDVENAYFKDIFGTYENYIEISVLPDIYRDELTAQYLFSENNGQVRLTAARKVDYISVADNADYPYATRNLINSYCEKVIETGEDMSTYGFTFLDSIYKGTMDTFTAEQNAMAATILSDAGWTKIVGTDVYNESSYGAIVRKYNLLTDNRFDDDENVRNDFTSNGQHSIQTGLIIKENELKAANNTTNGWFTSSTFSLDDATLKSRLFRVQVANEVDSTNWENGAYVNDVDADDFEFGHYRGGNYYLTPESHETGAQFPYAIYSSGKWLLIKVDEAVKSSKLTVPTMEGGKSSYYDDMDKNANKPFYAEEVAREIAYMLAVGDTWTQAANKFYVNEMAPVFHDTEVYEYFKSTFPDLFD